MTTNKSIGEQNYEQFADRYAARIETKPHNAYYERPATLSLLPDVKDLHVLDAGCGPGIYTAWLLDHGAQVVAIDVTPRMVELTQQRVGSRAQVHCADLTQPLAFARCDPTPSKHWICAGDVVRAAPDPGLQARRPGELRTADERAGFFMCAGAEKLVSYW
jgi:SAM-dependent methyltransferase